MSENWTHLQVLEAESIYILREVVAQLWAMAIAIEDGNLSDVEKALRAAQDALREALERGRRRCLR